MLKKYFFLFFLACRSLSAIEAPEITFEWLIDLSRTTAYCDHVVHFRRIHNTIKVRGMIECGLGFATKYFIDHANKVTSIELISAGMNDQWYKECVALFAGCKNWTGLTYNASHQYEWFNKADAYQCARHRNYALVDPYYLYEMDIYLTAQMEALQKAGQPVDVAFVDAGSYLRGDMVNFFLAKGVPIIFAHDTGPKINKETDEGVYGYFKIRVPPEYEEITIDFGQGTTFWILRDHPHVIQSMKAYKTRLAEYMRLGLKGCENPTLLKLIADLP